jgi:hypothetical protein
MGLRQVRWILRPARFVDFSSPLFTSVADMDLVRGLVQYTQEILATAEAAASKGETCSPMTILIGQDGAMRLVVDSDWPLDSLALHHGAKSAFRVSADSGSLKVEGREGLQKCVLESSSPARIARLMLSGRGPALIF